jgi:hypothetical protein
MHADSPAGLRRVQGKLTDFIHCASFAVSEQYAQDYHGAAFSVKRAVKV